MKRRNRADSSSLFLLELIIAILFFSLASAVCIQFFVKSHILSREARELSNAVNECAGAAEIAGGADSFSEASDTFRDIYPLAQIEDSAIHIFYDEDFLPCRQGQEAFTVEVNLTQAEQMLVADISMTASGSEKPLYTLSAKHFLKEEGR